MPLRRTLMEYDLNADELERAIVEFIERRIKAHGKDAEGFDPKHVRYVRVRFLLDDAKNRRATATLLYEEPGSEQL